MMQLAVVSIPVADQARSKAFYQDVVGFSLVREGDLGTPFAYILLKPPAGLAGISLVHPTETNPAGSVQGLMMQTLDVNKIIERLQPRGLTLTEPKVASWGRFTTFSDPDGNGWVIAEPNFAA
ncbi:MAG: VOC family protein [Pseudomonadota bacterium]